MSEKALSGRSGSERLAIRRRRSRRRTFFALGILLLVLIGAFIYGLWQPGIRISRVEVFDADASLRTIAEDAMRGSYFGIVPRDSVFFLPEANIRAHILSAHPEIAAVSIFRNGFTGISIKVDYRAPIARWCGSAAASTTPEDSPGKEVMPTANGDCYLFDGNGFLYATATEAFLSVAETASSSPAVAVSNPDSTLTPFVLFDSLAEGAVIPIGATLKDANRLPAVFDFARQVGTFGPAVAAIVIRGDETDFFLTSSTNAFTGPRITYLLGDEQNALTALVSAKSQLNLSDPTLQYVDLRFSGKIYLKRNLK
ncbi:hypothetical protein KGQ25_03185 [Patescibacteria group bacterium]|nr:hypothetical protein [Patescibacteria group bacterium]